MAEEPVVGSLRGQVPARILDLSLGGALLVVDIPLELGSMHDFAFDLDGETLWVQAEVRHCEAVSGAKHYHAGVEFVGVDPKDEARLAAYLKQRASS
ncbi:MAG: PilZ domain-containing protein [Vicinamibacteria bacterium]|jgi:c-di-GMP-binding flagellar brake protein YcgR|nr:PilZ domain-containing protein [Vicinamibacteria bacterium]